MRCRSATVTLGASAAALLASGCGVGAPPPAAGGQQALRAAAAVAPAPALAAQSASSTATPLPYPQPAPVAPVQQPAPQAPAPLAGPLPAPTSDWRSIAVGRPNRGRLVNGVPLPASGPHHITYDPVLHRLPNRDWRTWGTDRLVVTIQAVAQAFRTANPDAPPLLVGDLSLPTGGVFDRRYGGLGHASHQNGLDVDIQYPRKDRRLAGISKPSEVDLRLSQDLVDRFIAAGAQFVFIGPRIRLRGPEGVVQKLAHHDDHLHVRLRP